MVVKKLKINWWHNIILAIIVAIISVEFFSLHPDLMSKGLAALEPASVPKPVPMPTEINQNFLTQVDECFIPTAAAYGYTLRVTSGFRSVSEQEQTFNQGRTVNGHIVTWSEPGKSLHNFGYAIDVVDRWRGYDIDWKKLGKIGAFCGLEQVDDPHFEHRNGLTVADFTNGMRPQELTLPCAVMDERVSRSPRWSTSLLRLPARRVRA